MSPTYASIDLEVRVTGYYKVRDLLLRISDANTYRGAFRDYMIGLLQRTTDYARSATHVETGTLAAAHTWEYDSHRMRGRIYISPRYAHARGATVQFAYIYGVYEHARGGSHAFYRRTFEEALPGYANHGIRALVRSIGVDV